MTQVLQMLRPAGSGGTALRLVGAEKAEKDQLCFILTTVSAQVRAMKFKGNQKDQQGKKAYRACKQ